MRRAAGLAGLAGLVAGSVLGAGAALPPPAHAGAMVLGAPPPCSGPTFHGWLCPGPTLTFVAAPGEANRLTVAVEPTGALVLRDAAAPIAPGPACTALEPTVVRCTQMARLALGDGEDVAQLAGGGLIADGGPGDDVLTADPAAKVTLAGGAGDDVLTGGAGIDALAGGPGRDTLRGGPGDDQLTGDGLAVGARNATTPADDELDGGPGVDTVRYDERAAALLVEMGPPDGTPGAGKGGESGERDRLRGLERAVGGRGHDELIGTDAPEGLDGGPGDDLLSGYGGSDVLTGGTGRDRLEGGADNDVLDVAGDRVVDVAACGAGGDSVLAGGDLVAPDCERVGPFVPRGVALVRRTARTVVLRVPCGETALIAGRCAGRIEVRAPGSTRVLAARAYRLGRGERRVTVRSRRALPSGRLDVRVAPSPRGDVARWRLPARGESAADVLPG